MATATILDAQRRAAFVICTSASRHHAYDHFGRASSRVLPHYVVPGVPEGACNGRSSDVAAGSSHCMPAQANSHIPWRTWGISRLLATGRGFELVLVWGAVSRYGRVGGACSDHHEPKRDRPANALF